MQSVSEVRPGEDVVELPASFDAQVWFIGRIHTPWRTRRETPRRGDVDGPVCRIEVFEPWRKGLLGLERHGWLQVLYWMHQARRDLVTQTPNHTGATSGTFSLRSPNRPNPIASSLVRVVEIHDDGVSVQGLDCLDGTPLIDLKPDVCPFDTARPASESAA